MTVRVFDPSKNRTNKQLLDKKKIKVQNKQKKTAGMDEMLFRT